MFTYKKRAFKDDSPKAETDDSDDDLFLGGKKGSRRARAGKAAAKSSSAAASINKAPVPISLDESDNDVVSEEDNDKIDLRMEAKSVVEKLLAKSSASIISPPAVTTRSRASSEKKSNSDDVESEAISNAKKLLSKIGSVKRQLVGAENGNGKQRKINNKASPAVADIDLIDEDDDEILLPSVKRAADRTTAVVAIDLAGEILGRDSTKSGSAMGEEKINGPSIKLKTRLNGVHEWKFKIPTRETFAKLREKLGKIYGLRDASILKLTFDGDVLEDDQTPEEVDMEDEYMIDVSVPKGQYEAAIAAAKKFKDADGASAGPTAASSSKSTSSAVAVGGAAESSSSSSSSSGPAIKLKTRLNGEHESKFKLGKKDGFVKLREALGRMYGLTNNSSILKLKFDGDLLEDRQTPEQLAMEDEDMIDVTIPREKFAAALAAAKKLNP